MVRTEREMVGIYGPVLITTHPAPAGFLTRYVLCAIPFVLAIISFIAIEFMRILVNSLLPVVGKTLGLIIPDLPVIMEILVLCISPVGILLFFIYLGDALHRPELWIGSSLMLGFSTLGALFFLQGTNIPVLSARYVQTLLEWVAYLVQPSSVIAAALILAGVELSRRSIVYTITRNVVIITGGISKQVENVIPLHQVEKIFVVQSRLGRFFNTGTVVLQGIVLGNREIDLRRYHASGGEVHAGPHCDHAVPHGGSFNPYISLFGVSGPEDVKLDLEKAIELLADKNQK